MNERAVRIYRTPGTAIYRYRFAVPDEGHET